jgi:hypothetical protein
MKNASLILPILPITFSTSSKYRRIFSYFFLLFLLFTTITTRARNTFDGVTGGVWLDTDGKAIQAHGGQVQKIGDKWWWIGENRDGNRNICLYSSDDLYNWKNEGYAMRTVQSRDQLDNDAYFTALYGHLTSAQKDEVFKGIQSNKVIERPKLIYNKKTGKYILWFHADDSNYGAAAAGVAISNTITGPYTFIKRSRLHQLPDNEYSQPNEWYEEPGNRGFARDMNLFVDDDGTAYIIYSSEENRTIFISRLNDEYTDLDVSQTPVGLAKNGVDFIRLFPGAQREAPAMFKYESKYYLMTSGATGWDPNQARYWVADEIFGEWKDMGDPCVSEPNIPYPANLTFRTQSTNFIPVDPINGKFIYMGDRWNSSNLKDSRYVWLPVIISPTGGITLRSMGTWDLSIFETINNVKFDIDQFANIYYSDDELPETLQAQVRVTSGWETRKMAITWNTNIKNLPPASITNINGTFEINGVMQTVTVKAANIPKSLLYFIDCGATSGSGLYNDILTKGLAPNLININAYDQAFNETDGWGYTGEIGTDIDYKNPESRDAFSSGWWAYGDKAIDYRLGVFNGDYRLTVGLQEWWDTGRDMCISLMYQNERGVNVSEVLGNFYNRTESTQDYIFTLEDLNPNYPYITVSVSKTGNPDPLMSWLALTSLNEVSSLNNILVSNQINTLHIYPNPVKLHQVVSVEADVEADRLRDAVISVYDISGQLIKQQKVSGKVTVLDLSAPKGIYLIRLKDKCAKLIVK